MSSRASAICRHIVAQILCHPCSRRLQIPAPVLLHFVAAGGVPVPSVPSGCKNRTAAWFPGGLPHSACSRFRVVGEATSGPAATETTGNTVVALVALMATSIGKSGVTTTCTTTLEQTATPYLQPPVLERHATTATCMIPKARWAT